MTGAGGSLETSLTDLYEEAPCGLLSTAPNGTIVKVNETFLRWTGYVREAVLGRSFVDLLTAGCQLFFETRCLPVLHLAGEVREVALVLRRPDGTALSILINSMVVTDDEDRPVQLRIAVFDSTGRQDYERDLLDARRAAERSETRVRLLQEASVTFSAATSEEQLTAALAGIARTAFDATRAIVMVRGPGDDLRVVAGGPHPLGDSTAIGDELRPEAEALRQCSVVTVSSVDEAERTFPFVAAGLQEARLEAMTVTPLLGDEGPLAVFSCFFGRRRDFAEDEVELHRALARLAAEVMQRLRLQDVLQHLALHDQLTGLANRQLLQLRLGQVLAATTRSLRPMAVIFLDLDGFKAINDHLGHVVGDAVLIQVAGRLRQAGRVSDTLARFGGDEFVAVCEDADAGAAMLVAERIRVAVGRPLDGVPAHFPLTASIGVACHLPGGEIALEADALVVQADHAMYRSKHGGKDRYTVVEV